MAKKQSDTVISPRAIQTTVQRARKLESMDRAHAHTLNTLNRQPSPLGSPKRPQKTP